ncbi:MAG: hypothetical protein A3H42_03935 [Deltaproteobacteria bacterium RIFCSPLOWO2_02_FULL_46_8]|nr:MAG: hypothetical protein A3H42_03935 [Deltaproteobacteria bacterium RIFCSPLOWO2_02_FULL_46_8]
MVEPVKFPKYLTVHSTPPPEVDLSDDLYDDSRTDDKDQWNQLKWLVAGSLGGGTIDPSNPTVCIQGIGMVALSI